MRPRRTSTKPNCVGRTRLSGRWRHDRNGNPRRWKKQHRRQSMFGDLFAYPWILWFLFLIPLLSFIYWKRRRRMVSELTFSSLQPFNHTPRTLRERLYHMPVALRMLTLACLIVALARPQSVSSRENINTEGIDIVLVLDISGSMLAEDFTPNRLVAAKQVGEEFINGRTND